jgi:hypothetical protein
LLRSKKKSYHAKNALKPTRCLQRLINFTIFQ